MLRRIILAALLLILFSLLPVEGWLRFALFMIPYFLIGYDILPTDIRPETAAMFIIRSPKDGDHVKVIFHLAHAKESLCEIFWNEKNSRFDFAAGPNENLTRKEIQEVMNS